MGFLDNVQLSGIGLRRFPVGQSFTVPAPFGGLNLRDDITALRQNEARVLDNWIPERGALRLRSGFEAHGNSVGSGDVATLAVHEGLTGNKLIAAGGGGIEDVTTAGAGSSLGTGFSDNRWQTTNFNGRLFFVNGTDAPQSYDGSTLSATSWTGSGLTITNLVNMAAVRNRLWFCENDSADVWYGSIGGVTGALTKFQLSQIASGGACQAIGSWTRDGGDGADDFTVFVMNTGQIIVYAGDPASTFSLVGKYGDEYSPEPIGRQCLIKLGAELLVITRAGLLPISTAISGVAYDLSRIDPYGKIAPGIRDEASRHGSKVGWQGTHHQGFLYLNVPQTQGALSRQYVLNLSNGGWATISGWNLSSMRSFNGDFYFGSVTGGVVRKVAGASDNGEDITATARGAFVVPAGPGQTNLYTAVRPKIEASGDVSGFIGVDTDFFTRIQTGDSVELISEIDTTPWGSDWGSPWGDKPEPLSQWFGVDGDGRSVSVKLQAIAASSDLSWYASDVLMVPGGIK